MWSKLHFWAKIRIMTTPDMVKMVQACALVAPSRVLFSYYLVSTSLLSCATLTSYSSAIKHTLNPCVLYHIICV